MTTNQAERVRGIIEEFVPHGADCTISPDNDCDCNRDSRIDALVTDLLAAMAGEEAGHAEHMTLEPHCNLCSIAVLTAEKEQLATVTQERQEARELAWDGWYSSEDRGAWLTAMHRLVREAREERDHLLHAQETSAAALEAAQQEVQRLTSQDDDFDLVAAITRIVREADQVFERVGGSSRHWVRDCFLPLCNRAGLYVLSRHREADTKVWYAEEQVESIKAQLETSAAEIARLKAMIPAGTAAAYEEEQAGIDALREQHAARGDRLVTLYEQHTAMWRERDTALELVDAFKAAALLGGDSERVTPAHVERHITELREEIARLRGALDSAWRVLSGGGPHRADEAQHMLAAAHDATPPTPEPGS